MVRDIIDVQYPALDHKESVANISIVKKAVTGKGITIKDAFAKQNDTVFLMIENKGESVSALKLNAENTLHYISIELLFGVSAFLLDDLSLFKKSDGSIDLDFEENFRGTVYAIAKWNKES